MPITRGTVSFDGELIDGSRIETIVDHGPLAILAAQLVPCHRQRARYRVKPMAGADGDTERADELDTPVADTDRPDEIRWRGRCEYSRT